MRLELFRWIAAGTWLVMAAVTIAAFRYRRR